MNIIIRKIKKVDDQNTIVIVADEIEELFVLSFVDDHYHVIDHNIESVFDSVVSYHIISEKDIFTIYKVGDFTRVKICNTSYRDRWGIEDVCI